MFMWSGNLEIRDGESGETKARLLHSSRSHGHKALSVNVTCMCTTYMGQLLERWVVQLLHIV